MKTALASLVLLVASFAQGEIIELTRETIKDSQVQETPNFATCKAPRTSLYRWVVIAAESKIIRMSSGCYLPGKVIPVYWANSEHDRGAVLHNLFSEVIQAPQDQGFCKKSVVCKGDECETSYGRQLVYTSLVVTVDNTTRDVTDFQVRKKTKCE